MGDHLPTPVFALWKRSVLHPDSGRLRGTHGKVLPVHTDGLSTKQLFIGSFTGQQRRVNLSTAVLISQITLKSSVFVSYNL